jgi:hypothetical protein
MVSTYSNISVAEQELSVQVTLFNGIHVGNENSTLRTSAKTHHSPVLQHFTTNGARTNKEFSSVGNLLLELFAKNGNLAIITRSSRSACFFIENRVLWQRLKGVKVQVLVDGVKFPTDRLWQGVDD